MGVKAHPITASTPASTVSGGSISSAASKLSAAAYPLIKDVDWTSNLFSKPIPGKSPQDVMKAVDKMIVMGSAMDGATLKEAAQAHVKAIDGECEGCLVAGRFRGHQRGTWEGDCVGADQQGHGRLQCDGRRCWEQPCPQLLVLAGEPSGCAGGIYCATLVQRCCEGGAALSHRAACVLMDVQSIWTWSPFSLCSVYRVSCICLTACQLGCS